MRIIIILLSFCTLGFAANFNVVVLDPGHGGKDGGAFWFNIKEKDVTLDIAKRVEILLRARGIPTMLTRRDDRYVDLDHRAGMANRCKGALFVSIHFNASKLKTLKGVETYYSGNLGKFYAPIVQRSIIARTRQNNLGVKQADFVVLQKTKCPAILVECAFLSNETEAKLVLSVAFRQKIAEGIARGIIMAR